MNIDELKKLSGLTESDLQSDYSFQDKQKKIMGMPREHGLKTIWEWIKQDHINFREFQELIYSCYGNGLNLSESLFDSSKETPRESPFDTVRVGELSSKLKRFHKDMPIFCSSESGKITSVDEAIVSHPDYKDGKIDCVLLED